MRRLLIASCGALILGAGTTNLADGQTLTVEVATSAGVSTDEVSAVGTQVRAFGEVKGLLRYHTELAWARSSDIDSDAFGAAYPYGNRLQVVESYGERIFQPKQGIIGLKAGRFRPPFGISSASDHAYTGFLRAPLMRYDGYFALSNNFLEQGADVVVGVPQLTVEASASRPSDLGVAIRRPGLDSTVRVQGYRGALIVGASHVRTWPYQPARFARGRAVFTGLDVRWMRSGVQLRGEWITGRPFDGTSTTGWYGDIIMHRPAMGPVTAVARVEQLDYDTVPAFALHARRQTIGARIRILEGLSAQLNLLHHTGQLEEYRPTTLDVGVTFSTRIPRR